MIKKTLIDKVSKKFLFNKKDSKLAIEEFLDFKSVLNSEQKIKLMYICCSDFLLFDKLGQIEKLMQIAFQNNLLNKIAELLKNDPSLYVISNSHLYDHVYKLKEHGYEEIGPDDNLRIPSLIYDGHFYEDFIDDLQTYEDICLIPPESAKNTIVSNIISMTFKNEGSFKFTVTKGKSPINQEKKERVLKHSKERLEFLNSLVIKIGKEALNLSCVTYAMKNRTEHPEEHKKLCNNIIKIIRANYINPRSGSRERNWLIYVLIRLLTEKRNLSKNQAIIKVTKLLSKDYKELQFPSVNSRFFEDQKFAKKHNLSIKEIILKNDLQMLVNKYTKKLGVEP